MRFGKVYKRRVGAGTDPVLGSDTAPTGIPQSSADSQFSWKISNVHGFPIQRLVIGYSGPGGALGLSTTVYVFDDASGLWFQSETVTIQPGKLTWIDCPVLGDNSNGTSAGAIDACFVVSAAGGDPAGTYTFTLGADLSAGNANSSGSSASGSATAGNQVSGNASLTSIDTKLTLMEQPTKFAAITPADATDITAFATKGLWVGGAGTLIVKGLDGVQVSMVVGSNGTYVPGAFSRVMTATGATAIVAMSGP